MIRLISRSLIIPRGDTGTFNVPQLTEADPNNTAIFTILDPKTHTKVFEKQISTNENSLVITLTHYDTVNLPIGKFKWDIKYYQNPVFSNGELVDGSEVDSYYSAFSLPDCEIRQTGDRLLTATDAPITTISPSQLNVISGLITDLQNALAQMQTNITHYPKIVDDMWYVWDAQAEQWVNTNVSAVPPLGEYVRHDELIPLTNEEIAEIINNE